MAVIWNGITVPQQVWDAVIKAQSIAPIPPALLLALIHEEDGTFECARQSEYVNSSRAGQKYFDSNGREMSFGLLQLNVDGVGNGHTIAELQDCDTNIQIGVTYIAKQLDNGVPLYNTLGAWSTRETAWQNYLRNPDVTVDDIIVDPSAHFTNTSSDKTVAPKSTVVYSKKSTGLSQQQIIIMGGLGALILISLLAITMNSDSGGQGGVTIYGGGQA